MDFPDLENYLSIQFFHQQQPHPNDHLICNKFDSFCDRLTELLDEFKDILQNFNLVELVPWSQKLFKVAADFENDLENHNFYLSLHDTRVTMKKMDEPDYVPLTIPGFQVAQFPEWFTDMAINPDQMVQLDHQFTFGYINEIYVILKSFFEFGHWEELFSKQHRFKKLCRVMAQMMRKNDESYVEPGPWNEIDIQEDQISSTSEI